MFGFSSKPSNDVQAVMNLRASFWWSGSLSGWASSLAQEIFHETRGLPQDLGRDITVVSLAAASARPGHRKSSCRWRTARLRIRRTI